MVAARCSTPRAPTRGLRRGVAILAVLAITTSTGLAAARDVVDRVRHRYADFVHRDAPTLVTKTIKRWLAGQGVPRTP